VSTGEVPALLINASGTPASFGKAQTIGETAVATMKTDAAVRWDYFTVPELNTLSQVAAPQGLVQRVNGWWNRVGINLVAHPAATDAALLVVAAKFAAANLAAFRAETGLTEDDMVRMFRAQQFITHFTPHVIAGGTPAQRDAAIAAAAPALSAAAANVAALGFRTTDLRTYIVNPGPNVEHRQAIGTRALFTSALGQRLRNAMTDDSGFKLGRATIQQTYDAVSNAPSGAALTDAERAQATAYVHNHGAGSFHNVAGVVADIAANPVPRHPIPPANRFVVEDEYVGNVMAHWAGP